MKRIYIQPDTTTIKVNLKTMLMTSEPNGSQGNYSMTDAFGGNAGEQDEAGARRSSSFWDDED